MVIRPAPCCSVNSWWFYLFYFFLKNFLKILTNHTGYKVWQTMHRKPLKYFTIYIDLHQCL